VSLTADVIACAQIVERGDPARFRAVMAAPVAARAKLFPLYAFNVEVARAPWVTEEPMIAEMRLQWWRDALEEVRAGGPVRRHEVASPLGEILDAADATRLDALVEARRWDIYRDPFEDMTQFRAHIEATSGGLLLTAARLLDGQAPEAPLLQAGFAQGVANWLLAVPRLEAAGRIPLVEGTQEAVRALALEALGALDTARRTALPKPARPACLALWQTRAVLKRAAQEPARVAEGRLDLAPLEARLSLLSTALTGRW
jgi:phytoene synthase